MSGHYFLTTISRTLGLCACFLVCKGRYPLLCVFFLKSVVHRKVWEALDKMVFNILWSFNIFFQSYVIIHNLSRMACWDILISRIREPRRESGGAEEKPVEALTPGPILCHHVKSMDMCQCSGGWLSASSTLQEGNLDSEGNTHSTVCRVSGQWWFSASGGFQDQKSGRTQSSHCKRYQESRRMWVE